MDTKESTPRVVFKSAGPAWLVFEDFKEWVREHGGNDNGRKYDDIGQSMNECRPGRLL